MSTILAFIDIETVIDIASTLYLVATSTNPDDHEARIFPYIQPREYSGGGAFLGCLERDKTGVAYQNTT